MTVRTVAPGDFLTLHYRLSGPDGHDVVSTFGQQPATLTLGSGELAPALEARLIGLGEGSRQRFELMPGEVFGPRNPELLQQVRRSLLAQFADPDEQYSVGEVLSFPTPDGQGQYAGRIVELGEESILFDFNHPLAGLSLAFEVELVGVL
ncbi:MAG: FKBP-type peptidyl-prolyl cis-trans isomerase [Burkholderiales bacterium]|nr:FKBP-type peptidyl-prolyl cis-trans isomerase [Burkholderiales bacterium]